MKNLKEKDLVKYNFVKANMSLFELAYDEYSERLINKNNRKRTGTNYTQFIDLARAEFGYSPKTASIDIWSKFLFTEIMMGINDRKKKKQLEKPTVRQILGYIH